MSQRINPAVSDAELQRNQCGVSLKDLLEREVEPEVSIGMWLVFDHAG